jgi:hypothetical protein
VLVLVVLFGAVWADLNRPVSELEVDRVMQASVDGKRTSRWELAHRYLRGRMVAARISPGMTQEDVIRLAGAIPRAEPRRGGNGTTVESIPLDLWIMYRDDTLWINGRKRDVLVVERSRGTRANILTDILLSK